MPTSDLISTPIAQTMAIHLICCMSKKNTELVLWGWGGPEALALSLAISLNPDQLGVAEIGFKRC